MEPKILEKISCPLTGAPFVSAQVVNCNAGHSFSEQRVLAIFGTMLETGMCEIPGPCPSCKRAVTAYRPNPQLQELVDAILNIESDEPHLERLEQAVCKLNLVPRDFRYPVNISDFALMSYIAAGESTMIGFTAKCQEKEDDPYILSMTFGNQRNEFWASCVIHPQNAKTFSTIDQFFKTNGIKAISFSREAWEFNLDNHVDPKIFFAFMQLLIRNNKFEEKAKIAIIQFLERVQPSGVEENSCMKNSLLESKAAK